MIDIAEAVDRQMVLVHSPEGADDKFIQRCNLVAYLLLAERDTDAARHLDGLGEELRAKQLVETYLIYYWSALRIGAAALRGELAEASERHAAMERFVHQLRWPTAPYVRRRHERLTDLLPTLDPSRSRAECDRIVLDAYPSEVGPAWDYYARLVPCCELAFWWDA